MISLPLAHAGHWLAGLLYLAPVLILGAWLGTANLRERRRQRRGKDTGST